MIIKLDDVVGTTEEDEIPTIQGGNNFFTRVYVRDKVCVVGIDGGSHSNFAHALLVQELRLPTQKHPKPYAYRVNETRVARVTEQVLVPFSMGWYADVIHCDVVPTHMNICQLLLGRPWQYDRRTFHDGYNNTYTFQFFGKMVTLLPCSAKQIRFAPIPIEKTIVLGESPIQDQAEA